MNMTNPLYFFILGNHPAISVAEIIKKFSFKEEDIVAFTDEFLICRGTEFCAPTMQSHLGGTIKIGEIVDENIEEILQGEQKKFSGKFQFGLSYYGKPIDPREIWETGSKIKNVLREYGSVRFVRPQTGQTLTSVQVEKNGLIHKGIELCFLFTKNQSFIGKTLSVQDFESLGKRDFGRPLRDDYSGMLPPKLAQMMINLGEGIQDFTGRGMPWHAPTNKTIWDPFCGSGTILQEALLMGHKKVFGSDNSPKAVRDTRKNLEWLKNEFGFLGEYEVVEMAATRTGGQLSARTIITEPYLGSPKNRNIPDEIRKLETLYRTALSNWYSHFPNIQTIVMIWPVFVERGNYFYLSPSVFQKKWIPQSVLPQRIKSFFQKELSPRGNLLYGRPGQGIMREILVLKRSVDKSLDGNTLV